MSSCQFDSDRFHPLLLGARYVCATTFPDSDLLTSGLKIQFRFHSISFRLHISPQVNDVTQKPGPLVGRGLTSQVFEYGPGRVVKLFFDWRSREKVEREFMVT